MMKYAISVSKDDPGRFLRTLISTIIISSILIWYFRSIIKNLIEYIINHFINHLAITGAILVSLIILKPPTGVFSRFNYMINTGTTYYSKKLKKWRELQDFLVKSRKAKSILKEIASKRGVIVNV